MDIYDLSFAGCTDMAIATLTEMLTSKVVGRASNKNAAGAGTVEGDVELLVADLVTVIVLVTVVIAGTILY